MKEGDEVVCILIDPLKGNDVAPNLELGARYTIREIIYDKENNPHFDVALKSNVMWVRSFETKENLPRGDIVHWCHPSRFKPA